MSARRWWLQGYQWCAGGADTLTGLLLIVAPITVCGWLGIPVARDAAPLLAYVGVFVLTIGLSYFLCGRWKNSSTTRARWETTWRFTALGRSLVALFLLVQVMLGTYAVPWLSVAASDGFLALVQWVGLNRQWMAVDEDALHEA